MIERNWLCHNWVPGAAGTETQVFGPFSSTLTVETGLISMSIGTLQYKNKGHELGQSKPQRTCINRLSFPTAESAEGQLCPATRNLSLPLSALLLSAPLVSHPNSQGPNRTGVSLSPAHMPTPWAAHSMSKSWGHVLTLWLGQANLSMPQFPCPETRKILIPALPGCCASIQQVLTACQPCVRQYIR